MSHDTSKPQSSAAPDQTEQVRSGFAWLAWGTFLCWTIVGLIAVAWGCRRLSGYHRDFHKAGIVCWILLFLVPASIAVSVLIVAPPITPYISETRYYLPTFLNPIILACCASIFLIILWLLAGALGDMSRTLGRGRLAEMARFTRISCTVLFVGGITVLAIQEFLDLRDFWAYLHRTNSGWSMWVVGGPSRVLWRNSRPVLDVILFITRVFLYVLGVTTLICTTFVFEKATNNLVTSKDDVDKLPTKAALAKSLESGV